MARKMERSPRGKSGKMVASGGEDDAHPAATSQRAGKSRCPSPEGEGIKGGANPFMPGLRIREDGWTVARTRTFLALLAQTGCVADAARVAGVSRTSVNRSRKLFAAFDRACAEALAKALRGLEAVAYQRAVEGRESVILREGKEVERRIVPSDSLLGLLLKRGDLKSGKDVHLTPEEAQAYELPEAVRHRFLSREEYFSGIVFDKWPGTGKVQGPTSEETDNAIIARLAILRKQRGWSDRLCDRCAKSVHEE